MAEIDAGRERRVDRHRAALALARQLRRDRALGDRDERGERQHAPRIRAHEHVLEVARIVDHAVRRLRADRNLVAADVVFSELPAVEERAERRAERIDRDAEVGRLLAVDLDGKLGLRRVVVQRDRIEGRVVLQRLLQLERLVGQRVVVVAGDGEAQPLPAAADAEAVRRAHRDLHAGEFLELWIELLDDVLRAAAALFPWRQRQHDEAGIAALLAGVEEHVGDLAALAKRRDRGLDLPHLRIHEADRDALRRVDRDRDDAAILVRRELLGKLRVDDGRDAGEDDRRRDHDPRRTERHAEQAVIELLGARAECAKPAEQRILQIRGLALVLAKNARGEHRAERQRDEGGEDHGESHDEAELGEEPPGGALEERDRDEHRGERRGRGDDGEEHLLRAEHRGRPRAHAHRAVALDVFKHHDGVVDHEAGREHDREQRQDVDREPGEIDRGERSDQRDRHGDRRDDRRARRSAGTGKSR